MTKVYVERIIKPRKIIPNKKKYMYLNWNIIGIVQLLRMYGLMQ